MDSSNESLDHGEQPRTLSAETVLAVRRYNQQVASYTLRQWNTAKLESERKERDRRKRRADYLQQQQQQLQQTANAVPAVRPHGSLTSAGIHVPQPSTEGPRPNPDGPLMMVSKRRTDRAQSGGGSVPSVGPVQPITRHSHDQCYASRVDQHAQSYDIHADIASAADLRQQHQQAQQRPRRHQRSSHGSYAPELMALNPISPISAASTVIESFGRPEAKYVESIVTGTASSTSDLLEDRPLTPPRAWQRRVPASTPPITIPRPSVASMPTAAGSASSGGSSVPRSASPARALGFAAHLGMTSISTGPSTSALTESMSASTSTSNPTSEGSSRMSSFSENNGLPGIRNSLKMATKEYSPRGMDDVVRPKRSHRTSLGATTAQRRLGGPCAVEGAIGTLRRMTVSGDETGVFGALDHH